MFAAQADHVLRRRSPRWRGNWGCGRYAPGSAPRTFEVDGVRFGCLTSGMLDDGGIFATEAQGHAATNSYWVSFAVPAKYSPTAASGVVGPQGKWLARCARDGRPALATADLDDSAQTVEIPVFRARPWRRTARAGVYDPHIVSDPRSEDLGTF